MPAIETRSEITAKPQTGRAARRTNTSNSRKRRNRSAGHKNKPNAKSTKATESITGPERADAAWLKKSSTIPTKPTSTKSRRTSETRRKIWPSRGPSQVEHNETTATFQRLDNGQSDLPPTQPVRTGRRPHIQLRPQEKGIKRLI